MRELGDMLREVSVPFREHTTRALDPDYFSPTIPPTPPPSDKRLGDARVPYSRTYVRVNQSATRDQFLRAAEYAFDNGKMTVGLSADDAGIGVGLAHKRVVEIGGEFDPETIERGTAKNTALTTFPTCHTSVHFAGLIGPQSTERLRSCSARILRTTLSLVCRVMKG